MNNTPLPNIPSPDSNDRKYCPRCGKELPADAVFCGECGQPFSASTASSPFTVPPQPAAMPNTAPLKTTDYLLLLLLPSIPVVGLILLLVWAFSSNTNVNRQNFCRAQLIWMAISLVIGVLFIFLYAILFAAIMEPMSASSAFKSFYGMIFF